MPLARTSRQKAPAKSPSSREEAEEAYAPVEDASTLNQDVGFVLRLAQVAVFRSLSRALKPFDLRVVQYAALKAIQANAGLTQQHLGYILHVKKPNLVSLIDELESRGLVVRARSEGDRRSYALHLSDAAAKMFPRLERAHAKHAREIADALGGDLEGRRLLRLLNALRDV